ncbi:MAG: YqjF family protein [Dehalococcoidia bacterium]
MTSLALFLTAEWRHLMMLNYEVEPSLLQPLVPNGTELDDWQGRTFVSLVGFMFLNTKLMGLPVPFHRRFEEVNLRFYVRRKAGDEWRRGVVFVREIVPLPAIAWTARFFYNEAYVSLPMTHSIVEAADTELESLRYGWKQHGSEYAIHAIARGSAGLVTDGSEEEFIVQHYWGYTRQRDGGSVEYQVEHEPWRRVWHCHPGSFEGDAAFYGERFAEVLTRQPSSSFAAAGSAVTVHRGVRIA